MAPSVKCRATGRRWPNRYAACAIIVCNFFRMKVRMLFIVQYCYLDYSRPVTGLSLARCTLQRKSCLCAATYLHRSTRATNISSPSSSRRFIRDLSLVSFLANNVNPPSDEKLTRPVFDLKRADSDGHIILYVLKYFLDSDTYQVPEAKEIRFFSRSFDIFL